MPVGTSRCVVVCLLRRESSARLTPTARDNDFHSTLQGCLGLRQLTEKLVKTASEPMKLQPAQALAAGQLHAAVVQGLPRDVLMNWGLSQTNLPSFGDNSPTHNFSSPFWGGKGALLPFWGGKGALLLGAVGLYRGAQGVVSSNKSATQKTSPTADTASRLSSNGSRGGRRQEVQALLGCQGLTPPLNDYGMDLNRAAKAPHTCHRDRQEQRCMQWCTCRMKREDRAI